LSSEIFKVVAEGFCKELSQWTTRIMTSQVVSGPARMHLLATMIGYLLVDLKRLNLEAFTSIVEFAQKFEVDDVTTDSKKV